MHQHRTKYDRYNNLVCIECYKIFARNQPLVPDYVEFRTDAYRDI